MRVALLNTKITLRARHIFDCFAEGFRAHGDEPVWVEDYDTYQSLFDTCDVGVQICYANRNKGLTGQGLFRVGVNEHAEKTGKRILTCDTGFVKNQSEYELWVAQQKGQHEVLFDLDNTETYKSVLRKIYYEVGYDALKRHADYRTRGKEQDSSRWQALDVPLRPWRTSGKHILLIGQTVNGLSSQHVNIYQWYKETIRTIRKITSREIVFRHHPRIVKVRAHGSRIGKDIKALEAAIGTPSNFRRSENFLLEQDLQDCWAAVGFSSNASVTAAIHGVPIFVGDAANMAWEVGNKDLARIEKPRMPDRTEWANKLAWSQFNCAELVDGTCWAHFRSSALLKPTRVFEWRPGFRGTAT